MLFLNTSVFLNYLRMRWAETRNLALMGRTSLALPSNTSLCAANEARHVSRGNFAISSHIQLDGGSECRWRREISVNFLAKRECEPQGLAESSTGFSSIMSDAKRIFGSLPQTVYGNTFNTALRLIYAGLPRHCILRTTRGFEMYHVLHCTFENCHGERGIWMMPMYAKWQTVAR